MKRRVWTSSTALDGSSTMSCIISAIPSSEFLVQEMARFFKCKPTLKDVIAARNEYTQRDYWKYVNDLFGAAKLQAMFLTSALGAWNLPSLPVPEFSKKVTARVHSIFSVDPLHGLLMNEKNTLDEALAENAARLKRKSSRTSNSGSSRTSRHVRDSMSRRIRRRRHSRPGRTTRN